MDISLALSGSGFKFPAHVGGLFGVQKEGFNVVEAAGSSGGALVAALYACGVSHDDMYHVATNIDWLWYADPGPTAWARGALVKGDKISGLLRDLTMGKTFADVEMPLHITSTDVRSGRCFVFSQETTPDAPIWLAVRASISVPFMFSPVRYRDMVLIDGVISNTMPLNLLKSTEAKKMGLRIVSPAKEGRSTGPVSIAIRSLTTLIGVGDSWLYEDGFVKDVILIPTGPSNALNPAYAKAHKRVLFSAGYRAVSAALKHHRA